MNRTKRLKVNTIFGILYQVISVIIGFILPVLILNTYGSAANGLVNSISQFLGFISLCELGVNAVVQASLYRPIANGDKKQINRIMTSSRRFFRKIGYLLIAYVLVLIFVYPYFIKDFSFGYTAVLIFAVSINLFSQYFFGINAQILLKAEQKAYIPVGLDIIIAAVNVVVCYIMIKADWSIQAFKLISSCVFLIKPVILWIYVKKKYDINYNEPYNEEPIAQKWNGLSQHISSVVLGHTDVVILTMFSTLKNVSVYSVYFLIVSGLSKLFISASGGIESFFGSMLVDDEITKFNSAFGYIEWLFHTLITIAFSLAAVLIVPFVSVYTKNLTDANYIVPLFGFFLVLAYSMRCFQLPYKILVLSAGHFKQTQNAAIIEPLINIIISLLLVKKMGLIGVAIGTFVAMAYRVLYHVYYLKNNLVFRPCKIAVKHFLTDGVVAVLIFVSTLLVDKNVSSYVEWIILAAKIGVCALIISVLVNVIFYKKYVFKLFKKGKKA